jgi:YebC/PmpR family DNA-binding regulatory protein
MGRIFEKRKHKMFARYDRMAKGFTRVGKEIAIAVKSGGPDPANNPRLRLAMQNAKSINMPKDRVDAAIKRASSKDETGLEEIVYEGYGPHGIPLVIECATDNPTRTVANIRMYLSRGGGQLGKTGSLDFMFSRKGVFKISSEGINIEEMELELIDHGLEEIVQDEDALVIYTRFEDFGAMQKALEAKGVKMISTQLERIPTTYAELSEEQENEVLELVDKLEADDDIQHVYHNLK